MDNGVITTNRQARRDYEILGTIEAGIELRGNEVKSLRQRRANLKDSFARIEKGGVLLYNLHITPYKYARSEDVDPIRPRKLLLHSAQIRRLAGETSQKGMTLIALRLYFKKGLVKVELALAKGKRLYDKRETIKRKEAERSMRRILRDKKR
jgi:SsrA-binding protein